MFVVKVENDEATMYRAFRRSQAALAWAAERNAEDVHSLVDIFETAGVEDPGHAVAVTRAGNARTVLRGEAMAVPLPVAVAASDIRFQDHVG